MFDIENGKYLVVRSYSWTDKRCLIQVMSRQFKEYQEAKDWKSYIEKKPAKKDRKKEVFIVELTE